MVTAAVGLVLWRFFDRPGELSTREAFAAVALAWISVGLVGALPYLFTGSITNVTDAVFETVGGFSTTGSSIIPDPSLLPHGIQFWRSFTQWMGGMGAAVVDGGNPVGLSTTVNPDGSVVDNGGANPASGYGLFEASDKDDAIAKARGCPILTAGGSVELAEVIDM